MKVAFFGSSLVSAYWNGAATYYRGVIRALSERGFRTTFYEPDALGRQQHRDIHDPPWARVVVYEPTDDGARAAVEDARGADLVVKASGVGVCDELLEEAVLSLQRPRTLVAFWDVDAPATLARVAADLEDPFHALVGRYDLVFTYGGGPPVVRAYEELGARRCVPIYNALDPETHRPVAPAPAFVGTLGFLGNRLPDREARVERFFFRAAAQMPAHRFLLGGSGWDSAQVPDNVRALGHVYTADHNAFNVTPRAVLNVSREDMARIGYSPATRVFEAAGAAACLITDAWEGVELFFEPGREILVADDGDDVVEHLEGLDEARARVVGWRARARALAQHTYAHRARDVEDALGAGGPRVSRRPDLAPSSAAPAPDTLDTPDPPPRATARASGRRAADLGLRAPGPRAWDGERPLDIVILGLSITSSWGNGHATTYRSLVRALARRGHRVLFLERDASWYADSRDLPAPPYCRTELYTSARELEASFAREIAEADAVIVGSYVRDGIDVGRWVCDTATGVAAFYDIDTPVTLADLAAGECAYLSRDLLDRYHLYLSFTGGPTLARLERAHPGLLARPLYCSVDPEVYAPRRLAARWDLGYMGTFSPDRQPSLDALLMEPARRWSEGRFAVVGPQYPDTIRWPDNVDRIEHLAPPEHARFYNRQRFTLNVTRRPMIAVGWSPSVRLFEAAACGTAIISDCWDGLDSVFAIGREILVADDATAVLRALRDTSESQRRALGDRARGRVLSEHTPAHRAASLERYLREALACGARAGARQPARIRSAGSA